VDTLPTENDFKTGSSPSDFRKLLGKPDIESIVMEYAADREITIVRQQWSRASIIRGNLRLMDVLVLSKIELELSKDNPFNRDRLRSILTSVEKEQVESLCSAVVVISENKTSEKDVIINQSQQQEKSK
jgi:hypothetical protein